MEEVVEELEKNKKVIAIYLFGNRVKKAKSYSDWDLCVFVENASEKDNRT